MRLEVVDGKFYRPVEGLSCEECAFFKCKFTECTKVKCLGHERRDKKAVYFVRAK